MENTRKQIIFQHREALAKCEEAQDKQNACRKSNIKKCENYNEICSCQLGAALSEAKTVLDQKTVELQNLNHETIKKNEAIANANIIKRNRGKEKDIYTPSGVLNKEDLTWEKYIFHSEFDCLYDKEIAVMYGIPERTFHHFKRKLKQKGENPMKYTGKQVYDRSKLTVEKYKEHSKQGFSDIKIRTSYGFPKSSFDKWKSDNGLTKKAVATVGSKDTSPAKEVLKDNPPLPKKIIDNATEIKVEPELNLLDLANENIVLKQENERLVKGIQDIGHKMANSIKSLEEFIKNKDSSIAKLTEENNILQKENQNFQTALTQCQEELSKLINNRNQSDEDLTIAINKQFEQFERYEMLLLGRTLQLLKDKYSA